MTSFIPAGKERLDADRHLARSLPTFGWVDVGIAASFGALIFGLVSVAREWSAPLQQAQSIHLEPGYLPLYA